jgi:large subunit ribosomal protein L17
MRHKIKGRNLSRNFKQRKALISGMLISLIKHERIQTTEAKAKELRRYADKIVTVGKKNTLHARRQAFKILRDESVVRKLFDDIAVRNQDRNGGYVRLIKSGYRYGDSAPMSYVELV